MSRTSRASRLAPVVEMAENAERQAAQRLGQFQQQVNLAQAKLAELDRFREDYQLQWINRGGQGVSGSWLVNYQRFLGQLESAMTQQRQSLTWHQNNLNNARGTWQQAYARVEGLRKLVQRYVEEARMIEDKREQKLLDELSQRLPRHERY
ncbi:MULTISPECIES: flagellar export protein FliJ [Pseudomonas]|uniref:Flagellar FliJ protein n=1 Tax=Pseudomonas auratipiscis TaxID=3115853 RepID=A0AB35WSQ6_9PSED|nr:MULTISPECIES: flagellar export protein FliJ [unclassified Pseudomonas]MEE1866444.1 flagellar export protein FliJ [Pseudomonas sp. 120P]MEE1960141.1 flagellar export protein FliJ [Pseudomonas sp. 119P]